MNVFRKSMQSAVDAWAFVRLYGQHAPLALGAIFSISCVVVRMRGKIRDTDQDITVLYVGRRSRSRSNYSYLSSALFDDRLVVDRHPSNLLAVRKHMRRASALSDILIADIGWPYDALFNRSGTFLELPDWMNMAVNLADDWPAVIRSFRQTTRNNDLRLIRRNDYQCRLTRSRRDIEQFYELLYLPFIRHKHGNAAVAAPRRHVIRRALQGWLLQVLKGSDVVAAGVVYPDDGALYFLWLGIPKRHLENPPEAAISALYYFGIQHAFEQQLDSVDFAGTRPFLTDGAFHFKRKWGAAVEDTFSPSSILIKPQNGNEGAAKFCQHFPMLARRRDGLEAIFLRMGERVDAEAFSRLEKAYACSGIDSIAVIEIAESDEPTLTKVSNEGRAHRHVKTRLDKFAEHYAREAPNECQGALR